MTWTRPLIQTIYNRIKADMESYVTDGVPIPRVSLLGIINMVFSGAMHLTYGFLEQIKNQIFISTASEWGLTMWGTRFGMPRKAATASTGYIAPTGTAAHTVDEGTIYITADGYEFATQDDFIIGTDVEVAIEAVVAGADSNVATGETTLTLSSPDPDIDSVATILTVLDDDTVPAQCDDGTDLETLEAWAYRLLFRFRNPPSSGNVADYIRWLLEVPGVGRAWCIPAQIWGEGKIGLYVADYDMSPVSAGIISEAEDHIDDVKPIPAYYELDTITEAAVTYYVGITPYNDETRAACRAELQRLHLLEASPGGDLKIAHIRQALMAGGIDDYKITLMQVSGYGDYTDDADIDDINYPDVLTFGDSHFAAKA